MLRSCALALVLLTACGDESSTSLDTGDSGIAESDSGPGRDASGQVGAERLAVDQGVEECPVGSETPWFVDCDGDGFASSDARAELSCGEPAEAPAECGGTGAWTQTEPTTPETSDCLDSDAAASSEAGWWPDCDGDATPGASDSITSCGAPATAPVSCGLGEVGAWTDQDPALGEDCDDHDQRQGLPITWYVDCDEDGFAPAGLGTVEACVAPAQAPVPCGSAGGWTHTQPRHPSRGANNTSTDCNDEDANMRPGQTMLFTEPSPSAEAAAAFDYDCNGVVTGEYTGVYSCSVSSTGPNTFQCNRPSGEVWSGSTPGCGEAGELASGCSLTNMGSSCRPASTRTATQACR